MVDRNMKPKLKRSCIKGKDANSGVTSENNKVESSDYDPISFTKDPVEIAVRALTGLLRCFGTLAPTRWPTPSLRMMSKNKNDFFLT